MAGTTRVCVGAAVLTILAGCSAGPPAPAGLDPVNDSCAQCRMAVSDRHFAAQIAAPGEEPIFFDDLGCLREYLRGRADRAPGAVAFVADHRTADWVEASGAVFSRQPSLATPMASGLMAHRDAASRDRDPAATGATPVGAAGILGPLARRPARAE